MVFHSVSELKTASASVRFPSVAIGNLDGVHLGHQRLLASAVHSARERAGVAAVLTFSPHPQEVLHPSAQGHRLTTDLEKYTLLEDLGIDVILALKFDAALADLTPEAFFETYLRQGLHAASLHVGFDFQFGRKRSGDVALLRACGEKAGMQIGVIPAVLAEGARISSSSIRTLIQEGNMEKASAFMGRPYRLSGKVVHGEGRGKQLNTPTANVDYPKEKVAPRFGVYASRVWWKGRAFASITNFGKRPTFQATDSKPALETHLLDFQESLYGETISVDLLGWVRDEKRFDGIESLRQQIQADIATVRKLKVVPG